LNSAAKAPLGKKGHEMIFVGMLFINWDYKKWQNTDFKGGDEWNFVVGFGSMSKMIVIIQVEVGSNPRWISLISFSFFFCFQNFFLNSWKLLETLKK
jgi:hypothetical protein